MQKIGKHLSKTRAFKKLRHLAGEAIDRYKLISDKDSIVVAVSGGKDSLMLLAFLLDLQKRAPVKFTLGALHLGPGEENGLLDYLKTLPLDFVHCEPAPDVPALAAFKPGDPSPCFLCARARRTRLFELCRHFQANRLALGHHLDDAIETFLMNAFFSGRLEGLKARQDLFDGRLSIIRPLFLVPEELIIELLNYWPQPVKKSGCPAEAFTSRQTIKKMVANMVLHNPKTFGNLTAVVRAMA